MAERTVKEYAAIERVDERTVRRWIQKGAVEARRTPGGGIRIPDPNQRDMTKVDKSGQRSA
jgi:excisionase family DNA binding protein